ncbi:MAG: class I SAM-dependent methyltransferase [Pseudomonadota bacterium]
MEQSEFDKFADEYAATMQAASLLSNQDITYFLRYKVAALAEIGLSAPADRPLRILDFGAGVGASVPYFRELFADAAIACVDVSARSLSIGRSEFGAEAGFVRFDGARLPFASQCCDAVFAACVLHHIDHARHKNVFEEIRRVLAPGGVFMVFEHNPANPLTRKVVRDCPFDENAVLVRPGALRRDLREAGFTSKLDYRLFFPHGIRALRPMERWMRWLPLGAQYSVIATAG